MLRTSIVIEGKAFAARTVVRQLGMGACTLKGGRIPFGPEKGKRREISVYRLELSCFENAMKNLQQMEQRLDLLLSYLARLRAKYGESITIKLTFGTTVGDQTNFTRSIALSSRLLAKLAAIGANVNFSAYPCTEERLRKRLKWSEGVGRHVV